MSEGVSVGWPGSETRFSSTALLINRPLCVWRVKDKCQFVKKHWWLSGIENSGLWASWRCLEHSGALSLAKWKPVRPTWGPWRGGRRGYAALAGISSHNHDISYHTSTLFTYYKSKSFFGPHRYNRFVPLLLLTACFPSPHGTRTLSFSTVCPHSTLTFPLSHCGRPSV